MAAKTLQGTVISQKMNKTITVVVGRRTRHPKYGKYIKSVRMLMFSYFPGASEEEIARRSNLF